MDRRNFLQNLGLLGVIPLIPAWIDKELFRTTSQKLPKDTNLVIHLGDEIIGYTNNAKIEIEQNGCWCWETNEFIKGRKLWSIEFENLQTLTTDNPEKFLDLINSGEQMKIKFTKRGYKNVVLSDKGYFSELNLEAPYFESINFSGKIVGDGALIQIAL